MSKKYGVRLRQALLDHIETQDRELYEELLALRSRHAQGYRKRMKKLAKVYGSFEPERGNPITAERLGVDDVNRAAEEVIPEPAEEEDETPEMTQKQALQLLKKSIGVINKELATGRYDGFLATMLNEEERTKARHGAIKALKKRLGAP